MASEEPNTDGSRPVAGRALRADAQRNEDALLHAAKQIFLESGVDAPIRDIAGRAGVGLATLYRRFPTRSDLIAAVFRKELDVCAAAASDLSSAYSAADALVLWLERYTAFMTAKRGLSAALDTGDPAFGALPAYFRAKLEPALSGLLDAAIASGDVRSGVAPYDLLRAIGNLATATGSDGPAHTNRMVGLLIDGLRCGPRNHE